MKTLRFIAWALLLASTVNFSSAYAQYSRAQALARRFAPSPRPMQTPYQQTSPYNSYPQTPYSAPPTTAPMPPIAQPAPPSYPAQSTPAQIAANPLYRMPTTAAADPAKSQALSAETIRKTIEFQKKRAEEGSSVAQYDLGMRYLKGDGVEKDEETGRKWLEKAAAGGNSQAVKKLKELKELDEAKK